MRYLHARRQFLKNLWGTGIGALGMHVMIPTFRESGRLPSSKLDIIALKERYPSWSQMVFIKFKWETIRTRT